MKSIEEVRQDVEKRYGMSFSNQTWWNWFKAGLIPEARKIAGRGNALFMPDDASLHIGRIRLLSELGVTQKALKQWSIAKQKGAPLTGLSLALELACHVLDRAPKGKLSPADLKAIRADINSLFSNLGA